MRHVLTAIELDEFIRTHWAKLIENDHRIFELGFDDMLRVTNRGEEIYLGRDKIAALRFYNEAKSSPYKVADTKKVNR